MFVKYKTLTSEVKLEMVMVGQNATTKADELLQMSCNGCPKQFIDRYYESEGGRFQHEKPIGDWLDTIQMTPTILTSSVRYIVALSIVSIQYPKH
jgi:hypothetical protein